MNIVWTYVWIMYGQCIYRRWEAMLHTLLIICRGIQNHQSYLVTQFSQNRSIVLWKWGLFFQTVIKKNTFSRHKILETIAHRLLRSVQNNAKRLSNCCLTKYVRHRLITTTVKTRSRKSFIIVRVIKSIITSSISFYLAMFSIIYCSSFNLSLLEQGSDTIQKIIYKEHCYQH